MDGPGSSVPHAAVASRTPASANTAGATAFKIHIRGTSGFRSKGTMMKFMHLFTSSLPLDGKCLARVAIGRLQH
jgi:hypothetical protein